MNNEDEWVNEDAYYSHPTGNNILFTPVFIFVALVCLVCLCSDPWHNAYIFMNFRFVEYLIF
ncbi:hypothetical protein Lalb_Chr01g0021901 [Lupinus albus]|uniref:Uncharacterized protein n=1 Tax=Lupinus albus TaxID=3870 RepID=A0A6A4RBF6_LUPAL|nr:hypothetical protein Lalb_Chr01g0021901 [Lupinus albus]